MSLFNRNTEQEVPEIQVQGEEAVIPQTQDGEEGKPKKIKFPKKTWG